MAARDAALAAAEQRGLPKQVVQEVHELKKAADGARHQPFCTGSWQQLVDIAWPPATFCGLTRFMANKDPFKLVLIGVGQKEEVEEEDDEKEGGRGGRGGGLGLFPRILCNTTY